ncbi:hypothetical protein GSI_09637 [Ganoderma sinense ZZ0214-1]|uniref:Uncharacterized protein n=1 Tax=Ganoderma sinense ZZ0214-1 TaxID=1077348 RepID=A0A2G8S378_9APHY|nr:hypothetical protein GSI_09637 [Ganoderma sinense ZZ0214-1]
MTTLSNIAIETRGKYSLFGVIMLCDISQAYTNSRFDNTVNSIRQNRSRSAPTTSLTSVSPTATNKMTTSTSGMMPVKMLRTSTSTTSTLVQPTTISTTVAPMTTSTLGLPGYSPASTPPLNPYAGFLGPRARHSVVLHKLRNGLKSRELLGQLLHHFLDTKKVRRGLAKLPTKIDGALDKVMAVNDYAPHTIEAAQAQEPSVLVLVLLPFGGPPPSRTAALVAFQQSMDMHASKLRRLRLEAEVSATLLDALDAHLDTLHEICTREHLDLGTLRDVLLAEFWMILGWNHDRVCGFNSSLGLLREVGEYRKHASAHNRAQGESRIGHRFYVPLRIRTSYKARLEAVESWHVPEVEDEPEEPRWVLGRRKKRHPPNEPHKFKSAFEREKVAKKSRALFDVYYRLLGSNQFFLGSALLTTLDVVFAAHTHLLLKTAFPDPLVSCVLTESYPRFVTHYDAVFCASFSNPTRLPPVIEKTWTSSLHCVWQYRKAVLVG